MRYHHLGIPTVTPREGEVFLERYGVHVQGFGENPFGIEWMRYEAWADLPDLVKTVPHVAFAVDDLDAALVGHEVIIPPNSPSPGVTVAFVKVNGAPVEFLEFDAASSAGTASGKE